MSNMSLHMSWVTREIMCARKAECVWLEVVTERVMCVCVCVGGCSISVDIHVTF